MFINEFLKGLSLEQRQSVYSISNNLFWVAFTAILFAYLLKNRKVSIVRMLIVIPIPYAASGIITLIGGLIKDLVASIIEVPSYYPVYFIPIMHATVLLICLVVKMDFAEVADKFILSFLISRPFHCIACMTYGCCSGVQVDWGIYSGAEGANVVPLRLFEIILVLALWGVSHWAYVKDKFKYKGQCAAVGTILFGLILYLFDTFCTTPPKQLFFISAVGVAAIVNVIVGFIMLHVFSKRAPKKKFFHKYNRKKEKKHR